MDTILSTLVQPDLINLHQEADDKQALLSSLVDDLYAKGYVLYSFKEAILQREEEFPTGLQLENTAVAIPHTFAEHIKKPFVYVNKLKRPISFIQMGTDDVEVMVSFVLVLGISEPKNQLGLLMELMEKFADAAFLHQLEQAETNEDVLSLFSTLS